MTAIDSMITERSVRLGQIDLHYLEAGEGEPLVLLHGWPTSSWLWRNVIPHLPQGTRVLAPDLPGFGNSDKPDVAFTLDYQARKLDEFLDAVKVEKAALVLHDLGGPIGLLWAVRHPDRIERLVVLNTLLYPDGAAARLFWPPGSLFQRTRTVLSCRQAPLRVRCLMLAARIPGLHPLIFHHHTVALAMRMGVVHRLERGVAQRYGSPFATAEGRRALAKTFLDPRSQELEEIVNALDTLRTPTLVAFGERDRFLPDIDVEMHRLARDLRAVRVEPLRRCGHFLQEDAPEEVARLVAEFLGDWLPHTGENTQTVILGPHRTV